MVSRKLIEDEINLLKMCANETSDNVLSTTYDKIQSLRNLLVSDAADLSRAGYVYIISNPTTYKTPDIFKIGMTTREKVENRTDNFKLTVNEGYTLNAVIFSEDAKELESRIHKDFRNYKWASNLKNEMFMIHPATLKLYLLTKHPGVRIINDFNVYFNREGVSRYDRYLYVMDMLRSDTQLRNEVYKSLSSATSIQLNDFEFSDIDDSTDIDVFDFVH